LINFDNGMYKRILHLPESVNMRFRKVVVKTIALGRFGINSENNGTDCFEIRVRADTANVSIAGFKKER